MIPRARVSSVIPAAAILVAALLACLAGPDARAAFVPFPPANDDIADATVLSGLSVIATGGNAFATKESGEPNHGGNPGGKSVWWRWTAPADGNVTITTAGSAFDTLLGVYTGVPFGRSFFVRASDGRERVPAAVTFKALSGTTYFIAVDGFDGATGNIRLGLDLRAPPANDDFANAIVLTANSSVKASNLGATLETSEPQHAGVSGGKSLWWRWTAPSSMCVQVTTEGSNFDTVVAVYTGSSLGSLVPVDAVDDDQEELVSTGMTFNAVSGVTYRIAVDGYNLASGSVALALTAETKPSNDNFASATLLTGTNVLATGNNCCASREINEPEHVLASEEGGKSVWWRWVAPASGAVTIDYGGSGFNARLVVYTGSSLGTLVPVAQSFSTCLTFPVSSGVTYRIAVDGGSPGLDFARVDCGPVEFRLRFFPRPGNDNITSATVIADEGVVNGSNLGATAQAGEPEHEVGQVLFPKHSPCGKSVWYRYTGVGSLPVTLRAVSTNFLTTLSVYRAVAGVPLSVSSLTRLTGRIAVTATNDLSFVGVNGEAYYIAVDGRDGGDGLFTLQLTENWTFNPFSGLNTATAPANNNFAFRTAMAGSAPYATGRNTAATKESGEPNHAGETGGRSVWWTWTAPAAGRAFVTTRGSSFRTALGAYTGSTVSTLAAVHPGDFNFACPLYSFLDFNVSASQAYHFAVDTETSPSTNAGSVSLALAFFPRPANDNFTSAQIIEGAYVELTNNIVAATQQGGEVVNGISSGLRTVWYSWTAPNLGATSGCVTLQVAGEDFPTVMSTNNTPIVGVFRGSALGSLTNVPVLMSEKGKVREVKFEAQPGQTYRIVIAGGASVGDDSNDSYPQRDGGVAAEPLAESGAFRLQLNYTTLALRLSRLVPDVLGLIDRFAKVPFGACAHVVNYTPDTSGLTRVRLIAISEDGADMGLVGLFQPPGGTVSASGTEELTIWGAVPVVAAVVAVLEENVGGGWFTRDTAIVHVGITGLSFLCGGASGGGPILLQAGVGGSCFCPPTLTQVLVNGPASLFEGMSTAFSGTAQFNNGSMVNFSNTAWSTSDPARFPITTNGILSAGSVTSNVPLSVIAAYSYLGIPQNATKLVSILDLPPPAVEQVRLLPGPLVEITVEGVKNRPHVIEATTNLAPPVLWTPLVTNAPSGPGTNGLGTLLFNDTTVSNLNRRFYRTRELE